MYNKNYKKLVSCVCLFIPYLFFCFFLINGQVDWGGDYAAYLLQAKQYSYGDSGFLNKLIFTSKQSSQDLFPPGYPPMYSFLISLLFKINIENFLYLKFINVIFYLLFLLTMYFFCTQHFNLISAFLMLLFFSTNPIIIKSHINSILSDIVFLFFSTSSIFLMVNLFQNKLFKNYTIHFLLLLLFIFFSIFTKITGLVLIVTYFFCLIYKNYNKLNFYVKPKINFYYYLILIIIIFTIIITNDFFLYHLKSLIFNIIYEKDYLANFSDSFYHNFFILEQFFGGGRYGQLIFDLSLFFVLIGILRNYRTFLPCIIFSVLYFIIVILATGMQGERYLMPILPFYILFFYLGLCNIDNLFKNKGYKFRFFFVLIIFFLIVKTSIFSYREFNKVSDFEINNSSPNTKASQEMFQFIIQNTNNHDIFVFRKPRVLSFFTNRNSFMADNIFFLDNSNYNYLVLDKINIDYQVNYDSLFQSIFNHKKVFENNYFYILQRSKDY